MIKEELLEELTDKQQIILTTLMSEPTIRDAARIAGVSEGTIYNYKRDPLFRDVYRACRKAAMDQARRGLEDLASTASQALKEVMESADSPASARVMAARSVWTLITRSVDDEEVQDLLDELRGESDA